MKRLIITTLLFLFSFHSFSYEGNAVVRNHKNKAVIQKVKLENLVSDDSFDGEFFKIVLGKSNEAIKFSETNKDLLLKATTTYYHLTKARKFFVDVMESDYVKNLNKTIIRLDIKNVFHEIGHFANDNKDPQFNNALTIPAGKGFPSRGIEPWDEEIWFRPSKIIPRSEISFKGGEESMKKLFYNYRQMTHMQTVSRYLVEIASGGSSSLNDFSSIFRLFGASLIIEIGYQTMDELADFFGRRRFWLESALVPEIIYHEFAHVALSDHLELSHSTAVIEGMADVFASFIANSPKLAEKIKKYNTFNGKNAKKKQYYRIQFETTDYANADFVFGILYNIKDLVDVDGQKFLFNMRKELTTNSSIKKELIEAILETCHKECKEEFATRVKILRFLNFRGI